MPWVMPYLTVRDARTSLEFYSSAFGFEKSNELADEDGRVIHGEMKWHDMVIMVGPEGAYGNPAKAPVSTKTPSPINLYFYVNDVDEAYRMALDAGCETVLEPMDAFWGDRMAQVSDPDGYKWTLATNVADFDPDKVPR
ncbi:MAG: VOC family protein [Deltaproteobacteria bacterium]|nr:VOC family protein [Deltaproteobacteria bacterium]